MLSLQGLIPWLISLTTRKGVVVLQQFGRDDEVLRGYEPWVRCKDLFLG